MFNSPLSKEYCRASDDFFAKKRLTNDLQEGIDKAILHFENACKHFKKIKHYFGMMLSKQHVSNLLDKYQDCLPQGMKKFADRP